MTKIKTEAWVLVNNENTDGASLVKREIAFEEISNNEVLVKPLYGCLEGNFLHAINLVPENIFRLREESEIILGNSGVVEVERVGSNVENLKEGDICIYFCNGEADEFGFPKKITAYDKKNSMGVFAKKIKLDEKELIKIPENSGISLEQWAAFSLKYITAWSNWKVAYNSWKIQMDMVKPEETYVFGWGGGVTLAELSLARKMGCQSYLLTSKPERLENINDCGIVGVDRMMSEDHFLDYVKEVTNGRGASIFIDNIGQSVYKTTLRALGRQGVITTSGWKTGGMLPLIRANECQNRHIHVFTHYASYKEGKEAIEYAIKNNWLPTIMANSNYEWDNIPHILGEYKKGNIWDYFPVFKIN